MTNLTELEKDVLLAYYHNHYMEDYNAVWTDCLLDSTNHKHNVQPKQLGGVMASLSKKGLMETQEDREGNAIVTGKHYLRR